MHRWEALSRTCSRTSTRSPTVTEIDDGRVLEWLGRLGLPGLFDGRHRFELIPDGDGTRLIHAEGFTGALVPLFKGRLNTTTRAGFEAMNGALKARAEATNREAASLS